MNHQDRRTAIKTMGASCAALSLPLKLRSEQPIHRKSIRLGIIADLHGGLATDAESRLDTFLNSMAEGEYDALIQLGDFAFPNEAHQVYPDRFNAAHENTIHVIGNHEFDYGLSRADCFRAWGIDSAYYRRDLGDLRLLILDGNEKGSPDNREGYPSYVGKNQQGWMESELSGSDKPVLILSHQPLAGQSAIDNAAEIQELLGRYHEKIVLCVNGHSHVDSLLQVNNVCYLHVNSASYYWVGGETRMAYYRDSLFTHMVIDPAEQSVVIEAATSTWQNNSPARIGYFERKNAPPETIVVPAIRGRSIRKRGNRIDTIPISGGGQSATSLKVMTWNIWGRLNQDPRYTIDDKTARGRTIEIIRESGADLVALIETYGSAADIAAALNFQSITPGPEANLCILSRYPLSDVEPLDGLSSFSFLGATVTLPQGRKIRIYDVWLTSAGRHIVEIKNPELTDEAFTEGDQVRLVPLMEFLEHPDLKKHRENSDNVPVVVAGDFNCVSHLDHTAGTMHSKLNHSRILATGVSKAMHQAGFSDTFRQTNPDLLESTLGHTWTTVGPGYEYREGQGFVPVANNPSPEYRDPYARIDYIYSMGSGIQAVTSRVIAHHASRTDRSFPEFPSDHAAVITEFRIDEG